MRDRLTGPRRRQEAVQRWLPCWPSGDRGGKSGGRASRRGASEKQSSKGRSHSLSLAPAQSPLGPFHASSSAGALAHGRAPATAPAREQRRGPQRLKMLPFFLGRRSEKAASEATKCIQFFYPYLEHGGGSDDGDHLAGGGEGLADGSGEGRGLGGGAVEANELRELEGEASGRQRATIKRQTCCCCCLFGCVPLSLAHCSSDSPRGRGGAHGAQGGLLHGSLHGGAVAAGGEQKKGRGEKEKE